MIRGNALLREGFLNGGEALLPADQNLCYDLLNVHFGKEEIKRRNGGGVMRKPLAFQQRDAVRAIKRIRWY